MFISKLPYKRIFCTHCILYGRGSQTWVRDLNGILWITKLSILSCRAQSWHPLMIYWIPARRPGWHKRSFVIQSGVWKTLSDERGKNELRGHWSGAILACCRMIDSLSFFSMLLSLNSTQKLLFPENQQLPRSWTPRVIFQMHSFRDPQSHYLSAI